MWDVGARLIKSCVLTLCTVQLDQRLQDGSQSEVGVPRFLYTGTTEAYFREYTTIEKGFVHQGGQSKIWLDADPWNAIHIAYKRARQWQDSPLLVIVDTSKSAKPFTCSEHYGGVYHAHVLDLRCLSLMTLPATIEDYLMHKTVAQETHLLAERSVVCAEMVNRMWLRVGYRYSAAPTGRTPSTSTQ